MSAQVQPQRIRFSYGRTMVIALIAFTFGVVGAVAIQRAADRTSAVEATSSIALWDTGRLEAMEGRQAAASISTAPVVWDSFMSEAMQGRELAETVSSAPVVWDRAKVQAMEGRQLAEIEPVVWDSFMSEPNRSLIGEFSHGQL